MPKFKVSRYAIFLQTIEVDAETEDEALEKSQSQNMEEWESELFDTEFYLVLEEQ